MLEQKAYRPGKSNIGPVFENKSLVRETSAEVKKKKKEEGNIKC